MTREEFFKKFPYYHKDQLAFYNFIASDSDKFYKLFDRYSYPQKSFIRGLVNELPLAHLYYHTIENSKNKKGEIFKDFILEKYKIILN